MSALFMAVLATTASTSPFNGTWWTDMAASDEKREPVVYSLRGGVFTRGAGAGATSVKADARFHPTGDRSYVDAIAVTASGSRRLREIDRLRGRVVYTVEYLVSANGKTLRVKTVDFSKPSGKPIPYLFTYHRLGYHAPGTTLLPGRWRQVAMRATRDSMIDEVRLVDGRLSVRAPSGYGFSAVVNGPAAPVDGDIGTIRISMPNERRRSW